MNKLLKIGEAQGWKVVIRFSKKMMFSKKFDEKESFREILKPSNTCPGKQVLQAAYESMHCVGEKVHCSKILQKPQATTKEHFYNSAVQRI